MKEIALKNLDILKKRSRIENFDLEYSTFKDNVYNAFSEHPDCTPIFIAVTGSVSYGLDLEKSDIDGKGVYIQNIESILSEIRIGQANPFKYTPQIGGKKKGEKGKTKEDVVFYELGRYIEMVHDNNPNIMELFNTPEDCIVYKHPIWDEIVNALKTSNVLTKKCYYTFWNYATQQINKATGLNKKINNPMEFERKTPIDFCHVIFEDDSTMSLRPFLEREKLDQKMCGLVKVPHARDLYGLYYDYLSGNSFSRYIPIEEREVYRMKMIESGKVMGLGYKGIIKESEDNQEISNEIRVSSIPKDVKRIAQISYNKDGYMSYCKDYREFWGEDGWMNKRNEERYKDNISSGQNYDGKNMSHCVRLLYMACEIADELGVIVRRNDEQRKELLEIKKGLWNYDDIITKCETLTNGLKEKYEKSSLPDTIDFNDLANILHTYRKKIYFST